MLYVSQEEKQTGIFAEYCRYISSAVLIVYIFRLIGTESIPCGWKRKVCELQVLFSAVQKDDTASSFSK